MKQGIYTLHVILRDSEDPHFACGVYSCVACDCGNNAINQKILTIQTRCELKVRTVVTMKATLFCIRVEIYCRNGGTDVGCTLLDMLVNSCQTAGVTSKNRVFIKTHCVFGEVAKCILNYTHF